MKKVFCAASLLCLLCVVNASLWAVDVTVTSNLGESFATNTQVTFTANATGVDAATVYTWNFDDNTGNFVVTGTNTITHVFTSDEIYAVTVTVNNGKDPAALDFILVEAISPPDADDLGGLDAEDPDLKSIGNPDDGITFNLTQSQGGFVSGSYSESQGNSAAPAPRAGSEFTSDFGDSISGRTGTMIQHRYMEPGIFILSTTRSQGGSETGMLRKTLAFSIAEIKGKNSDPNVVDPALAERRLIFKNFKGKFAFKNPKSLETRAASTKTKSDTVAVSWEMTLPKGFDVTTQNINLAIGNVVDSIPLDKNGKGLIVKPSPYKSVKFKFPHLKKGETRANEAFKSTVTVQMSNEDLTGSGFDTEGISPKEHLISKSKTPMPRKIQVATTFAGVAYAGVAQVNMVVNSDNSFGNISSRSGPSK